MATVSNRLRLGALTILTMVSARTATAHPTPETRVWLDAQARGLQMEVHLPLNRLEFVLGRPLADHPATVIARDGNDIAAYLLAHVGVRSGGPGWTVLRPVLSVMGNDRSAELIARFDIRAPQTDDPRRFTLLYDAITHEIRTHRVQVFLRNDWHGGRASAPPLLLGELQTSQRALKVSLGRTTPGAAWRTLFATGAQHIAEGVDHLLFVFLLVLVALLTAAEGRWHDRRSGPSAIRTVASVVSAFTVGHSVTLALGASGVIAPPVMWVESAVAGTILIAAVHAICPLHTRGEFAMAGVFGLIHGFAFAGRLDGAGLTITQRLQALIAFNLGIEAMQLAVIVAVLPALLLILRASPWLYARCRVMLATAACTLACGWLAERLDIVALSVTELAGSQLRYVPIVLWIVGGVAWLRTSERRRTSAIALGAASAAPFAVD